MTHILVRDGRVITQGGRVLTSAGGAPCCCGPGGGGEPPCPGISGFCMSAFAAGFSPDASCTVRISSLSDTANPAEVTQVLVDGPLPTINSSAANLPFQGLIAFQKPDEQIYGTDTNFRFSYVLFCRDDRPAIREARIDVAGGGSEYNIAQAGGSGGTVFLWRRTFLQSQYLDNGPVTLTNDLGDLPCVPGNTGNPVCRSGTITVEASFDTNCQQTTPNLILASKCSDASQTIVVDQGTSNGLPGIRYQGEEYRPLSRTQGTPVDVEWVQEVCGGPVVNEWPVARLCGGTSTISYDPDTRPADGVTLLWGGNRYVPIENVSTAPPVVGTWSTESCPSSSHCADLSPNDPRCANPIYRDCPQCVGYSSGGPIIRPTDRTDPALVAEIQRQQMARTGQYPGRCPSCGG